MLFGKKCSTATYIPNALRVNLFSVTKAKAGFHALKGFFKFDSPTGEAHGSGNPQLYQSGEKGNETVCDESHAKQDDEKVTPWF